MPVINRPVFFYFVVTLFVGLLCLVYGQMEHFLPQGVHSWAQADRYALAHQYAEGTPFFQPKTFNLMSEEGRVGVEFPIHAYLSSLLSQVLGQHHLPLIMRSLNLLLLMLGLIFFARQLHQPIYGFSLAATLFLSPGLVFYAFNFLPDVAGLALLLFSFGHLLKVDRGASSHWQWALFFAGLATLIKTTSGVFLLAIMLSCAYTFMKNEDAAKFKRLSVLGMLIIGMIVAYDYFYFHQVNRRLWSIIFMSETQPITSWQDLESIWKAVKYWWGQWMLLPQLILILLFTIVVFLKKPLAGKMGLAGLTLLISIPGLFAFMVLMGKQYINHDYYFIASLIPASFLLAGILWNRLESRSENVKQLIYLASVASMVWCGIEAFGSFEKRNSEHFTWKGRTILNEVEWMRDGGRKLTDLGISEDDRIFVLYEFSPNVPLVYFNRKGRVFNHEEMKRPAENISYWADRIRPHFVIMNKKWLSHFPHDQPLLYRQLLPVHHSGEMLLYRWQPNH